MLIVAYLAMLELPLHHAYFLLPLGLVIGAIDARPASSISLKFKFFNVGRIAALVCWASIVCILALVIYDYQKIERSYEKLRFRQANPVIHPPPDIPQVLLLTQWKEFFWLTNFEPTSAVTDAEIKRMVELTNTFPSAGFAQKTATAMVERDQPDEAKLLLTRACRVNSVSQCDALRAAWAGQASQNKRITFETWP